MRSILAKLATLPLAVLMTVFMFGCGEETEDAMEDTGEAIEEGAENTGEAVEEGAEEAEEGMEDMTDE